MAEHAVSEGARYERAAFRGYLRRQIKKCNTAGESTTAAALVEVLHWTLKRQERYDPRKGGLGRR